MISLFKRNSAPVQTAMLMWMIQMVQEYQREVLVPALQQAPEQSERVLRLAELGFSNSKAVKEHKRQEEQYARQMAARQSAIGHRQYIREAMETLLDARRRFGPDTLLIRFDDFEKLMKRFGLVCGTFGMYKGDVPLDKLDDIERLKREMQNPPEYVTLLRPVSGIEIIASWNYSGIPKYIRRFPFVFNDTGFSIFNRDSHGHKTHNFDKGYELKTDFATPLFICAPAKDMEKLDKVVSIRRASDPFICAHTKYGILVFTRWGEEAGSEVIRRYEQVNKMIEEGRIG
jgi:hypothetical protein